MPRLTLQRAGAGATNRLMMISPDPEAKCPKLPLVGDACNFRLINAHDLAKMLSIGERTIWRLLSAGKLPRPVNLGRKLKRWDIDEIRCWIAADCPSESEWEAGRAAWRGGNK